MGNGNYGASYSDDDIVIYSPQGDGTFADHNYSDTYGDSNDGRDNTANKDQYTTSEFIDGSSASDEMDQLDAIREIEKSIDYHAIEGREGEYEELYRTMSDKDKRLVVGLSDWLVNRGVVERQDTKAHVEEEDMQEVFGMTAAAAMSDGDVNPDSYSDDVVILSAVEENVHASDHAGYNPNYDVDEEYDEIRLRKGTLYGDKEEPEEQRYVVVEDEPITYAEDDVEPPHTSSSYFLNHQYDDEYDYAQIANAREIISPLAKPGGNIAPSIVSRADEVLRRVEQKVEEAYSQEHSDEPEVAETKKDSTGRIAISDIALIKKLLDKDQLSDQDIADIVDGADVDDITELRSVL